MTKLKTVKIGSTVVPHGLFLAPMAGFTDLAFRKICVSLGAEYTVTEMVSAKAICYGDKKTGELARIDGDDAPTAIQIFGHWPADTETAVRALLSGEYEGIRLPPAAIDINMGCPVKKIFTSGDGSALMRDPALCEKLVASAVRAAGDVPVTVKIRAGIDASHKNAAEVATSAVRGGAAAVFVHGRTRDQFYAPSSSNDVIAAVRDALPDEIPVIGNGDVTDPESAFRMLDETGCDGVMIGRAALGDPWIFSRIIAASDGVPFTEPAEDEKINTALGLCRAICERYGEEGGVPMCRGRAGHFIKGMRGAPEMRNALCRAKTYAEIESVLRG